MFVAQTTLILTIDSVPISHREIVLFFDFSGTNGGSDSTWGPGSISSTRTSDFGNKDKHGCLPSSMHS